MLFDTALSGLQARVAILESVVEILSGLLAPPKLFVSEVVRGFRYENPDVRHFCLLKAVRAVSALNAAIELCAKGLYAGTSGAHENSYRVHQAH